MGAVSLAQRGGILGSGIYQTQKPNVDVAGAIGAISQALTAQREGVIQRAYLQHQRNREDLLDARAAIQTATENAFRQRQLEQAGELARGQHDIEQRRIDAETQTKIALAQLSHEVGMARAKATLEAAQARATGTEEAARIRGPLAGNNPDINSEKQDATSRQAASSAYTKAVAGFMKQQRNDDGSYRPGLPFDQADAAAKRLVRGGFPQAATELWGPEAPPMTSTQQGELDAGAKYQKLYNRLNPKDPSFAAQKASLDQAMMQQLQTIHSQPPQAIAPPAAAAPAAPASTALPSGSPEDDDQEP